MAESHPIVGAWRVHVQIPEAPPLVNLALFTADGGLTVAFPSPALAPPNADHRLEDWTTALGAWAASEHGQVARRFVSLGGDERGLALGTPHHHRHWDG